MSHPIFMTEHQSPEQREERPQYISFVSDIQRYRKILRMPDPADKVPVDRRGSIGLKDDQFTVQRRRGSSSMLLADDILSNAISHW